MRAAHHPLHVRPAAQRCSSVLASRVLNDSPGRAFSPAKGANEGLRRHVIHDDVVVPFGDLPDLIDGLHGRSEPPLWPQDDQRQHEGDRHCQLPAEDEQRRRDHCELQNRVKSAGEQVPQRARQREQLGIEQRGKMPRLRLVEVAHRQALQQADQQAVQVAIKLAVQVRLDDHHPMTGERRQGKQGHENDQGCRELPCFVRNQRCVDEEPDREGNAHLEQHRDRDGERQQDVQLPVGAQVDPDGLVQQMSDLRELGHGAIPESTTG